MDRSAGFATTEAAIPSHLRAGFASMRSSLRTTVARWSSAASTTSSRRWRSCSSSVIARALQQVVQAVLVALQHLDRLVEDRMALLGLEVDVRPATGAGEQEDRGRDRDDHGPVLLARVERKGEDREQQAERDEVERGDGDDDESHQPGLLFLQLDDEQLETRAH